MARKKYYNPQTNIFDLKNKIARSWDWYDDIWKKVGKCVFCDLRDRYIIFEKNGVVLTTNLFPYTDAHLLIIPRRHIEYVKEFTNEEWEALRGVMYVAKKVLRKVFKKKNLWFIYREGALGQAQKTVGHLHIQVVPYSEGLVKINYQPISWAPGEVGDRLKEETDYLEDKYEKYLLKYGKYKPVERRIVVNGIITNSNDEILLVRKKNTLQKGWQTPSGGVEGNESLQEALKREVMEETNLRIKNLEFIGIDEEELPILFEEGFVKKWRCIFMHYRAKIVSIRGLKQAVQSRGVEPSAGDDAKEARWVPIKQLKRYKLSKLTEKVLKKVEIM
ncbi:MAG: NUDIX domain-containing protein [Candidatus Dojkabacteria bacterium]|nr:NUDIX domain-containing protein [Candidatus Dojkabacteria bacterium]